MLDMRVCSFLYFVLLSVLSYCLPLSSFHIFFILSSFHPFILPSFHLSSLGFPIHSFLAALLPFFHPWFLMSPFLLSIVLSLHLCFTCHTSLLFLLHITACLLPFFCLSSPVSFFIIYLFCYFMLASVSVCSSLSSFIFSFFPSFSTIWRWQFCLSALCHGLCHLLNSEFRRQTDKKSSFVIVKQNRNFLASCEVVTP
jgi:hypothetical protein